MQDVIAKLNALCEDEPYVTGWYLQDLESGAMADRNGEMVFPSASTRKISIMMAALAAVHAGTLSLDDPFEIEKQYQDNNSGVFQFLSTGITISFRDALTMMIIVSDNACTGKIVDILGLDAINAYTRRVGMVGSTHRFNIPPKTGREHSLEEANTTTPADVGRLLELILQGTTDEAVAARLGVTTDLCKLAIDILLRQRLTSRLPNQLPTEARVAHKTGTGVLGRNNNDAGIVFQGDSPLFILTVYTEHLPVNMPGGTSGYLHAGLMIAKMAKAAYDAFSDPAKTEGLKQAAVV
ncbi:MAG TPA: serine hydrolase [Chloroflexota bacterium]|nr:serine hydrolase [Chloroflexota bacterium]